MSKEKEDSDSYKQHQITHQTREEYAKEHGKTSNYWNQPDKHVPASGQHDHGSDSTHGDHHH